jgi:hypothetical protein
MNILTSAVSTYVAMLRTPKESKAMGRIFISFYLIDPTAVATPLEFGIQKCCDYFLHLLSESHKTGRHNKNVGIIMGACESRVVFIDTECCSHTGHLIRGHDHTLTTETQ